MTVALVVTRLAFDTYSLFAVMGVMTIMLYLGTMDDILSLSPRMRFIVEILVILLLIFCNKYSLNDFHVLWGIYQISDWEPFFMI
jgi:UDP-N-acetylmuramyl pentapeptide phosphotransferase/UDP-N-acetylglucosamine-1-phosphate transferase